MNEKISLEEKAEELIEQGAMSLDDGISFADSVERVCGLPRFVVYYDLKKKHCFMVDVHRLSDAHDESDEILVDFIRHNRARFVAVSDWIGNQDFELMRDFASEKGIDKLFMALEGKRPMANFKAMVTKLGLDEEWFKFRDNYYDDSIKKMADKYGIVID